MSSNATDLPDLLGCWVTLSSAGFCLTALSSRYWQSFHTMFQRLPNSQKEWYHNNLPLGGQGSWGPWRQVAEVANIGKMAMLGPIHCRIVTSSWWMDFFSLLSRGFASLCLLHHISVIVLVKPLIVFVLLKNPSVTHSIKYLLLARLEALSQLSINT